MKKYDAVIAGYLCVDIVPGFQKNKEETSINSLFKPGRLIEIEGLDFFLGGLVANTGMAMRKFNKRVFLNGLLGNDVIGKIALDRLRLYQLADGIRITENEGTAFGIVIAPSGVDRIFLESPGCSKIFDTAFIDYEAVSNSRLFHFGYPPLLRQFYLNNGEQLLELFSRVKESGVVSSLDFSLPDIQSESAKVDWLRIAERILPYVDIFVPSLEEVLQIMMPVRYHDLISVSGDSEIIDLIPVALVREIGKKIIDFGVKILMIKAGHRGVYLLTGDVSSLNVENDLGLNEKIWNNREFWCNAYPVDNTKFKNATGAGDTAAAAFLSSILDGQGPELALKFAAIAGRNKLYCNDIAEELKNWQNMENELNTDSNELTYFELTENQ